jgi:drug/metabolite transporter (DMT)-like permease
MDHIGPFTFQAVRCAMAVVALLPVTAVADRFKKDGKSFLTRWADKKLWKAGILCGIPLFLACNLQQVGLVDVDAGKSGFLTAMYIVIVPVIGIFLKKKPTIMIPISVALAVVGLYFLSCMGATSIQLGDLLLIGCALMFAIQITLVDQLAQNMDGLRLNTIQALVCAVLSSLVMAFTETPTLAGITACTIPLIHVGVFSMGIGYYLQIVGQQSLDSTPATLIMSLESVFAALFGVIFLKESMTGWEIFGSALIFAAVILSQLPLPQRKAQ